MSSSSKSSVSTGLVLHPNTPFSFSDSTLCNSTGISQENPAMVPGNSPHYGRLPRIECSLIFSHDVCQSPSPSCCTDTVRAALLRRLGADVVTYTTAENMPAVWKVEVSSRFFGLVRPLVEHWKLGETLGSPQKTASVANGFHSSSWVEVLSFFREKPRRRESGDEDLFSFGARISLSH